MPLNVLPAVALTRTQLGSSRRSPSRLVGWGGGIPISHSMILLCMALAARRLRLRFSVEPRLCSGSFLSANFTWKGRAHKLVLVSEYSKYLQCVRSFHPKARMWQTDTITTPNTALACIVQLKLKISDTKNLWKYFLYRAFIPGFNVQKNLKKSIKKDSRK